jgi:hypothetical protein
MMKQLEKDLKAVTKQLKRLAQETDKIIKQFERLEKAQAAKEPKTKKAKEVTEIDPILARIIRNKIYPTDIVLARIIGSRDGIDLATLKKKTGFKYYSIKNIIHMLRIQGKIKSKRKEGLRGPNYLSGGSRTLYLEA